MKIAIVGSGYVGLVTGVCLSEVGHDVTCVDTDTHKLNQLHAGISPIFEADIEMLMRRNIAHNRLHFTADLAVALDGARVCFIAVGTPEQEDGSADLTAVTVVAQLIGEAVCEQIVVVVKSTVPVGTCEMVDQIVNAAHSAGDYYIGHNIPVVSNPEFLKEGLAVHDFMHPDRIIVGVSEPGLKPIFQELYAPYLIDDPAKLIFMDRRSAELTKYASNAMLASRISFMNEMALLCEAVGADIDRVRIGMGADPRIGRKFLQPGPGYGGSCFPKDVSALIAMGKTHNVGQCMLFATKLANERQKHTVAQKIINHLGSDLEGKTIAVWGLTFKPGTDDVRESPAEGIINVLLAHGADVQAHDPEGIKNFSALHGEDANIAFFDGAYDALHRADALVLVTEWPEYLRPSWDHVKVRMKGNAIFDFRNAWTPSELMARGFHYECVGRPDSRASGGEV